MLIGGCMFAVIGHFLYILNQSAVITSKSQAVEKNKHKNTFRIFGDDFI